MREPVDTERHGAVVVVTLNRPDRLNALDRAARQVLASLWRDVSEDPSVRCVVVTGAGRAFCSGADVDDLAAARTGADDVQDELAFLPGRRLDVPVVVAVNGVCAGGGLHFVADGDIVLAAESASFLDPHVSVGQVSGIEPASLLLRLPLPVIMRLTLGGRDERLSSAEALMHGLVSEVVPHQQLGHRAEELAQAVAASSPAAVRATRSVLRALEARIVGDAMAQGWGAVKEHWAHPDAREGPAAFAERRQPRWTQ
ncbi:MAG: enoyl-CoA hydratase/isomerase family protein [Acidimicrobiales bacterium]